MLLSSFYVPQLSCDWAKSEIFSAPLSKNNEILSFPHRFRVYFIWNFAVKTFCSSACIFSVRTNEKSRQNKFPSWSQSKVSYWRVWRGWSKAGPLNFNLMPWNWQEKPLFQKLKVSWLHHSKSVFISFLVKKRKKSNFWSDRPWVFCPSRPNGKL